jgi:hypothetical protein
LDAGTAPGFFIALHNVFCDIRQKKSYKDTNASMKPQLLASSMPFDYEKMAPQQLRQVQRLGHFRCVFSFQTFLGMET